MSFTEHFYEGLPADPLRFWQALHPHPRHGFFQGSRMVTMSAAEPALLFKSSAALFKAVLKSKSGSSAPRFAGVFSFEAGRDFDCGIARLPRPPDPLKLPLVFFGDYRFVVRCDHVRNETALLIHGTPKTAQHLRARFERLFNHHRKSPHPREESPPGRDFFAGVTTSGKFQVSSRSGFSAMVRQAKEFISRGDIYQANLSLRLISRFTGDPIQLYANLTRRNPSPYRALFKHGDTWIVSCSPELLMKVEGSRVITRPIAGTRPRGKTAFLDRTKAGQLLLSPKERAEHIMLVDLERNDLGRVCRPGSVRLTEGMSVKRYSHVMHIESQVEGTLSRKKTSLDALKSLFPGGTITGCPKIKSIEVIQRIEGVSRSIFYGSAGTFSPNGDAVFNILIRTALIKGGRLYVQAGAGIVADSDPGREYKEVLAKAHALVEAVKGT